MSGRYPRAVHRASQKRRKRKASEEKPAKKSVHKKAATQGKKPAKSPKNARAVARKREPAKKSARAKKAPAKAAPKKAPTKAAPKKAPAKAASKKQSTASKTVAAKEQLSPQQKAANTHKRLAKKASPRRLPKTRRELQKQNKKLQEKIRRYEQDRRNTTKRERRRQLRELEAERQKQLAEEATYEQTRRQKQRKQRTPEEQRSFMDEAVDDFRSKWDDKIKKYREDGKIPTSPEDKRFKEEHRHGFQRSEEIDIDLTPQTLPEILRITDILAKGMEDDAIHEDLGQGLELVWNAYFTIAAFGPELVPYGVVMLEPDEDSEDKELDSMVQAQGVVQTGLYLSRGEVVEASKEALEDIMDDRAMIRVLFVKIEIWRQRENEKT